MCLILLPLEQGVFWNYLLQSVVEEVRDLCVNSWGSARVTQVSQHFPVLMCHTRSFSYLSDGEGWVRLHAGAEEVLQGIQLTSRPWAAP